MNFSYRNRLINKDLDSIVISHGDPSVTTPQQIRYDVCLDIGINYSAFKNNDKLEKKTITGGKYAVFLHKGTYENLIQTYAYIFI